MLRLGQAGQARELTRAVVGPCPQATSPPALSPPPPPPQRVRFVGDPVQRIREDYLRILRYFRFHGRVCSEEKHEPDQLEAVRAECAGLTSISGERIWAEMRQILRFRRGPALVEVRA